MIIKGVFGLPSIRPETNEKYKQPIPTAVVTFVEDEGEEYEMITSSIGRYEIDLPAGFYSIEAYIKGDSQAVSYIRQGMKFIVTKDTKEGAFDEWLMVGAVKDTDPVLKQWLEVLYEMRDIRSNVTKEADRAKTIADGLVEFVDSKLVSKQDKLTFVGDGKVMREGAYGLGTDATVYDYDKPRKNRFIGGYQSSTPEINSLTISAGATFSYMTDDWAWQIIGSISRQRVYGRFFTHNATTKQGEWGGLFEFLTDKHISQSTGSSTTNVMSQKAVTDRLNAIANTLGNSTTLVASQKLVNDVNAKIPISTDINGVAMMRTNAIPTLTQSDMTDHVQAGLNQPVTSSGVYGALEELKQRVAALEAKLNEA